MFELLLEPLAANPHVLHDPCVVGAVVNKGNVHWVALKVVDERIWLLDSQFDPQVLNEDHYLQFIKEFPHAYPIRRLLA